MMWWNWETSWFAMWLMMAIVFGGLSLLIIFAWRAEDHSQRADRRQTDARQVLALRLARGEIDATEYLDRINALSGERDA
jgi:uncharacterized membrane protein